MSDALVREKQAVIDRIRAYLEVMRTDKRMKVGAGIILREIDRIEKEEAERTRSGARG